MATKLQSARQFLALGYADIVLANLVAGAANVVFELPQGAVLLGGTLTTTEVFNSTTSDTFDIGDLGSTGVAANATRYATALNVRALGVTDLVDTGYVYPAPTKITAKWNSGGGVPTTGKATLTVWYYVRGRSQFAQGLDV